MKNNYAQFKIHKISLLLFINILLFTGSCKKELLVNEKLNNALVQRNLKYKNGPQITNLTFIQFKGKVNQTALGNLKKSFNIPDAPNRMMSLNAEEVYKGFTLLTDSIKMIMAGDHTSYVFAVKLATARSASFQNLTIDESPERTTAFITTYTPTKAWIKKWQDGIPGKFDGSIVVTPLDLDNGNTSMPLTLGSVLKNEKISSTEPINKTSNVAPGCTEYTFYYREPYQCGSGNHWPGDTNCTLTGNGAAGYANFTSTMTICNGGGGGGGTTPNPDPDYNPCPKVPSPPPMIEFRGLRGERLAVVPPPATPCDLDPLPEPPRIVDVDPNARPCLKNIKAALESLGMQKTSGTGLISDVLNKLNLSKGADFNAILTEGITQPGNLAETILTTNSNNWGAQGFVSHIKFDSGYLNKMTDIAVAATMMHEYIHAYFDWNIYLMRNGYKTYDVDFEKKYNILFNKSGILPDGDGSLQHKQIAESFVSSISSMLNQYASSQGIPAPADPEYFNKMGWIGLTGSPSAKYAPQGTSYTLGAEEGQASATITQKLNCKTQTYE